MRRCVCVCRIYEINSFNKRFSYEQYSIFFKGPLYTWAWEIKKQLKKVNNKHKVFEGELLGRGTAIVRPVEI